MTPTLIPTRIDRRSRKALAELQRLMRLRPIFEVAVAARWSVPEDIAADTALGLSREDLAAIRQTEKTLLDDPAFEHLGDAAKDRVWRFASQCALKPKPDFVASFIADNAHSLETATCYLAVEHLAVTTPTEVAGVRFVPVDAQEVPRRDRPPDPLADPQVRAVAVVGVTGTDYERMTERAEERARHALRVLRIALREHNSIVDQQLRFRLGRGHAFGPRHIGWKASGDAAYELELRPELIALANQMEVLKQPESPVTGLDRQADIAIRWMERASFTAEPIVALLFLFFALEALLGQRSEGEKGHMLALRQSMLSHVVTGGFPDPNLTFRLYDEVRSGAVHGEDAPVIDWDIVHRFAGTVRWTLNQYLKYAHEHGFQRRGRLLRALDTHPDRPQLVEWLSAYGGPWWAEYFGTNDKNGDQVKEPATGEAPSE